MNMIRAVLRCDSVTVESKKKNRQQNGFQASEVNTHTLTRTPVSWRRRGRGLSDYVFVSNYFFVFSRQRWLFFNR